MIRLLFCILLFSPSIYADDLLDVLNGSNEKSDGLSLEKKSSIFKSIMPRRNAEQNIFFQFLEKGDYNKALYQWPSAFEGGRFANTGNGRALYGYLLFKNGLKLTGIETLFSANPTQINKTLIGLWRGLMQTHESLWTLTDVSWNNQWTKMFGLPAEVAVRARRFDADLSLSKLEDLLRKTTSKTWERSWTEWRFVTSLLFQGEDIKAAKLLKHLQGIKENNPVSTNLMNITAARMLYQNGYLSQSIRYYEKVDKGSDYWFEALEEMGWAELRLGKPQNTLAHTQTLLTPSLEPDVGPETFYLASLANLKICDYVQVSQLLKEYRKRFQTKAKVMMSLRETPDNKAVQTLFTKLENGRTSLPALGQYGVEVPRHSTRDENLFYLVSRQKILRAEAETAKKLYSNSLSEGTAQVGFQAKMERFKKSISQRARNSFTASLNRVKKLAQQEIDEISSILKKMQIVEAELIQQLAMTERVIEDSKNKIAKTKKGTTGSQAKDTLKFPYQGEIWFDELANYKIDIAKGCQSGEGKTL